MSNDAMYKERQARIKYHDKAFLNPKAIFLRDLSIAFVRSFATSSTRILDPTGATGIRGIRYYKETRSKDVTILDINKKAAEDAKRNVRFNKVKIRVYNNSIQEFANGQPGAFYVIDLDPFGTAAPYIYDLMKVISNRGYLLVTATDTAVLCGAHEKACVKQYDAKPMHNELCQEIGIRILLGFIARTAAQFNCGIDVVMSLSHLHYMKVFVRVNSGAEKSTASVKNLGYVYYCSKCGYRSAEKGMFTKMRNCPNCKGVLIVAGRLWAGSIQEKKSLKSMLGYIKRFKDKNEIKRLETMYNEPDIPLYYVIPKMTKRLGITATSPNIVIERLKAKGYIAARTNFDDSGVKTDATISVINGILKQKR